MAIGTPFSGDMCPSCECTPCQCEKVNIGLKFPVDHLEVMNYEAPEVEERMEPAFDRYNLVDLAQLIQKCIRDYQTAHPYSVEQTPVVNYTLGEVLKAGKGIWSPAFIKQLIYMERSAYRKGSMLLC